MYLGAICLKEVDYEKNQKIVDKIREKLPTSPWFFSFKPEMTENWQKVVFADFIGLQKDHSLNDKIMIHSVLYSKLLTQTV